VHTESVVLERGQLLSPQDDVVILSLLEEEGRVRCRSQDEVVELEDC